MDQQNVTDFKELVRKIEKKQILLPDFQRDFVWKDEEKQIGLVCSLLAKMPLGSILLLKSKADEYVCTKLGTKSEVKLNDSSEEVEFLLDGQQRLTVLSNVLSNVIFENCDNFNDLISPSLKKRFFLRIPKWESVFNNSEKDLFGVKELHFTIENPDSDDPDFLTEDIKPFIECLAFNKNDKLSYNPLNPISTELDTFCIGYEKGYLIPLYLLAPTERYKKPMNARFENIIKDISKKIQDEIENSYLTLTDESEKRNFLYQFVDIDKEKIDLIINNDEQLKDELSEISDNWNRDLRTHLIECVKNIQLNQINIHSEQRARAIDVYENLNRGGIKLGTFDLVIARAAKKSEKNLRNRIIDNIYSTKNYFKGLIPDVIENIKGDDIKNKTYNASVVMGCYDTSKNEIAPMYIDCFLTVLSLYVYNKELDYVKVSLEQTKRNKILELKGEDINDKNCEIVCEAIDRALFFLQTRCGIRKIKEINYSHILKLVSVVFLNTTWFKNSKIHDALEAFYWTMLFSGEFDKDQNCQFEKYLKKILETLKAKTYNFSWIKQISGKVFDCDDFSDRDLLLMNKAKGENKRTPKEILRKFICQFYLAQTYPDMFEDKTISVFCKEKDTLEAHHIIPLGSTKKYKESSAELRQKDYHICNSPLNFVYITKDANLAILEDPLDVYEKKIQDMAKSSLHIKSDFHKDCSDDEKIEKILGQRFEDIKGDVKKRIKQLLQNGVND